MKLKKPVGFFGNDDSINLETKEPISLENNGSRNKGTQDYSNLETSAPINKEIKNSRDLGKEASISKETKVPINLETKDSGPLDIVKAKKGPSILETYEPRDKVIKGFRDKGIKESKSLKEKVSRNKGSEDSMILEFKEPRRKQNVSKQVPNSKGLINQGYMMDEELIAVLAFYTVLQNGEDRDKSTVLRKALRSYIPEKYFKRYREQMKEDSE